MDQNYLLHMLRATIPRDNNLLETFLRYQANHFDEDWETLLQNFLTHGKEEKTPIQLVQFETDISAFVKASSIENSHDLRSYTEIFGQAGLKKLPQLTSEEKALIIEVALFNLATRFQLLDQEGAYQTISVSSLLEKSGATNLVNVYRVANNLSDRISRDIEQFLLTYEPEVEQVEEVEVIKEITFREEGFVITASLEEDLSQLDLRTGQTEHLPAYENLNLAQKFEILSHFEQVRNSRPKLPNLRRGEFDHEMEMTPVYEDDNLLTYLEADGSVYELKRPLTPQEEVVLTTIGQGILAENTEKLTRLGIDLSDFEPGQVSILLDAAGRFRLKNADLALLGGYPEATVTQLALATELLQMGPTHDKVEFFLTSQLALKDLRPIAYAFLHEELSLDQARTFESEKLESPTLTLREWRDQQVEQVAERNMPKPETENPLVQEVLERYPIGSTVSYKGQDFQMVTVEDADLNGLIRIELRNAYSDLIEQNPVLYLRTFEEISQALHKLHEEVEVDQPIQELDLIFILAGSSCQYKPFL